MHDATHAAVVTAEGGTGRPLLVIFSDGLDTVSWLEDQDVLETIRKSEVLVYAVTVEGRWNSFLKDMTHASGGSLFEARSNRDLRRTFLKVLEEFKSRYLLGYSPTGVPLGGWHRLDVRVKGRSVTVKARPGYFR